jgi:uncharacterized protein (DUF433 family)
MTKQYVIKRNGGFYVGDTRVSLASVVLSFKEGASPESILQNFPALRSLENVYGAITFYLANTEAVEADLADLERQWREFAKKADPPPPGFVERVRARRKRPQPA